VETINSKKVILKKANISFNDIILVAFLFLYMSGETSSFLKFISFALFLLWLFLTYLPLTVKGESKLSVISISIFLFLGYYFLSGLIHGNLLDISKQTFTYLLNFSPYFIYNYFKNFNRFKYKKILTFLIFIYIFTLFFSLIFLINNPFLPRIMTNDGVDGKNYFFGAGYFFAYSAALLSIFLCTVLKQGLIKSRKNIFILLIVLVSSYFVIYLTGSTITFVFSIIGSVISFLFSSRYFEDHKIKVRNFTKNIFFLFLFLILFLTLSQKLGEILMNINYLKENAVQQRLFEIGEYLAFRSSSDSNLINRFFTIERGFTGILSNPIFGVGHKVGNILTLAKNLGVSGHSEILDIWSMHGIIGLIMVLVIYISFFKIMIKKYKFFNFFPLLFTIVFMSLFNPFICFQTNYFIFVFVPISLFFLKNKIYI